MRRFPVLVLLLAIIGCPTRERDYREDMREFIGRIKGYARGISPGFLIIPQNGDGLLTIDGSPDGPRATDYLSGIDGLGREDLFYGYNGVDLPTPESERKEMIEFMDLAEEEGVEVLVVDYCSTRTKVDDSYLKSYQRGYISFAADHRELDNIPSYPDPPFNVNSDDITSLSMARNFLYLINPGSFPTKDSLLLSLQATNYDLLIIDLFYEGKSLTSDEVASLKVKKNGGKRLVIAYLSIGEAEDYRYYWQEEWEEDPPPWLAEENPNWPGNYRVRYWDPDWQQIIFGNDNSYLRKILDAGFDGVYLDKVDTFEYFEGE